VESRQVKQERKVTAAGALVNTLLLLMLLLAQCDGQDFTARLRELKFHCLLFLNIPKYASSCSFPSSFLSLYCECLGKKNVITYEDIHSRASLSL